LNPFRAVPDHRPDEYEAHRLLMPVPLPVSLNPAHGPALLALPFAAAHIPDQPCCCGSVRAWAAKATR